MASIDHYKAQLISKSFHKQPRVDFGNTFNLVVKPTTIRLILSLPISFDWSIRHIDVQNALLHGWLLEDVYKDQPLYFIHPQFPYHVVKFHKALYDIKQAPRAWYSRYSDHILEVGFGGSHSDSSLFILQTTQHTTYVLIYVDDILITSSHPQGITNFLRCLLADFAIKDLGPLHFFLRMEAITIRGDLILSQHATSSIFLTKATW